MTLSKRHPFPLYASVNVVFIICRIAVSLSVEMGSYFPPQMTRRLIWMEESITDNRQTRNNLPSHISIQITNSKDLNVFRG